MDKSDNCLGAFDKWARLGRIIMQNGGPIGSAMRLWRIDTLKEGKLVGKDSWGNTYYENPYYMIGRCRWVIFNPLVKFEYDASHVTSEWYGWLHYKTDRKPSEDCAKYCLTSCNYVQNWLLPHMENLSGSELAFYPYSTTPAYIQVWDGTSGGKRGSMKSKKDPCKR